MSTSEQHRVVITGIGVVSPLGTSLESHWDGVKAGRSGAKHYEELIESGNGTQFLCRVDEFDPQLYMEYKTARRTSRFIQFAVAAAQMAMDQSQLPMDSPREVGVYIGTGAGGFESVEAEWITAQNRGLRYMSPFGVTNAICNMAAGNVAIRFGAKGPCIAPVAACAAGLYALHDAFYAIKHGRIKAAFAGGSESTITSFVVGGYEAMRVLSTRNDAPEKASRPFDTNRDGFVFGEGASVLILERYEDAVQRGAPILAELASAYVSCDASHISSPDTSGETIAYTMSEAIRLAGISPEQVDLVQAHGTSTKMNDEVESLAIRKVFGEDPSKQPYITALKSMIGHSLGASGALAVATSVKAIEEQHIPVTINTLDIDPMCAPLNVATTKTPRDGKVQHVLINAFGFGGHNACIMIKSAK